MNFKERWSILISYEENAWQFTDNKQDESVEDLKGHGMIKNKILSSGNELSK